MVAVAKETPLRTTIFRSNVKLDPIQARAVRALQDVHDGLRPSTFIKGPAGTGKSAVIAEFIASASSDTITAAPTHKACEVLRSRGVDNVRTIHSLMYKMQDEIELIPVIDPETGEEKLDDDGNVVTEEVIVGQRWLPRQEPIDNMVIFEEASMIGASMMSDIERVTKRRAFVGDHFQLPPVRDIDVFHAMGADVELRTVYRIKDSGPLALATALREGRPAQPHLFGIPVLERRSSVLERVVDVDGQLICWKNATRRSLNRMIRNIRGCRSWVPESGDRIIFYETDTDMGVYNGLGGVVKETLSADDWHVKLKILTDAKEYRIVICPSEPFMGREFKRSGRRSDSDPIHVEYAYAMTCHKMQGSEHPDVFVVDDTKEMHARLGRDTTLRWLYTAVTRTSKNLSIMR
jgi:exodeoxyribonuclease-5